jgi:hypothetical protein
MLRPRAVRSLLTDVAAVRLRDDEPGAARGASGPVARAALRQASRRALLVVAVDALALAVLFLLRDRTRVFLVMDRSTDAVFTVGVLLVAAHLGFRFAQYALIQRVNRALDQLPDETPDEPAPSDRS